MKDTDCSLVIADEARIRRLDEAARESRRLPRIVFTDGHSLIRRDTDRSLDSLLAGWEGMAALECAAVSGARFAARLGPDMARMLAAMQPASLLVAPLFHVSGCHNVFLSALANGGKIVILARWQPACCPAPSLRWATD